MTNLKVFDMVRFDKTVTFVTVSKRAAYDIILNDVGVKCLFAPENYF